MEDRASPVATRWSGGQVEERLTRPWAARRRGGYREYTDYREEEEEEEEDYPSYPLSWGGYRERYHELPRGQPVDYPDIGNDPSLQNSRPIQQNGYPIQQDYIHEDDYPLQPEDYPLQPEDYAEDYPDYPGFTVSTPEPAVRGDTGDRQFTTIG